MIEKIIENLKNKKIAILGFGCEGESTYHFIREYLKDIPLTIIDQNPQIREKEELKKDQNLNIITGDNYLDHLEKYNCIIKTPGISLKNKNIEKIKDYITSQLELLLEVKKENVIGITGTKGKSTTTSLIYEIIKDQNPNVALIGNIGIPPLSIINTCNEQTIFVAEMSSHQLEFLKHSPKIGIVLNLFEDHLDHAGTKEHYHNIKLNMFKNQTDKDIMIYCKDNETLKQLVSERVYKSKAYSVSLKREDNADISIEENQVIFNKKTLYDRNSKRNLIGNHNLENIMVALLVSELLKLNLKQTIETIQNFKPLAYRLEKVGKIENVTYYVDTLATIPAATIASINSLKNVNTLIFGGMDRGISYIELIEFLKHSSIEHFICMPTTGYDIGKLLNQDKTYYASTLKEAVILAKEITKENTICLLSPAAPSYNEFKNYQEKGDKFKEFVLDK